MKKAAQADPMERYRYTGPLRTAASELPRGDPWNHHWGIGQGETLYPLRRGIGRGVGDIPHWTDYTISLIALNTGKWIARPLRGQVLCTVDSEQIDTREEALRRAVAEVIRRARYRSRDADWRRTDPLSVEWAERLIAWALGVAGRPARKLYRKPPPAPIAPELPAGSQLQLF